MPPRRIGRESQESPKFSTSPLATSPSPKRKNPNPKQNKSKAGVSAMLEITRFRRTFHLLIPRLSFARVVNYYSFEIKVKEVSDSCDIQQKGEFQKIKNYFRI
jgi:hypothetical protein